MEATSIANGERPNREMPVPELNPEIDLSEFSSSSSESEVSMESINAPDRGPNSMLSELQELGNAIKSALDTLFRTSMFIRKFAPKDKRLRASETRPFDSRSDTMYINDKYHCIARDHPWLAMRLGEANARRRQYFKYRRDHHERLSAAAPRTEVRQSNLTAKPVEEPKHQEMKSIRTSDTKPTAEAETEATKFLFGEAMKQLTDFPSLEKLAMSTVSFATSVAETSDKEIPFPAVPDEALNGSPFLCPYCFTIQSFKQEHLERHWRFVDTLPQ